MGNNQGNTISADIDGGNADASTSSIILAASNTHDNNNDANNNNADAEDAAGKKTLMRDPTTAGSGNGASALAVILPLRDDDIGSGPYNSALALSVHQKYKTR